MKRLPAQLVAAATNTVAMTQETLINWQAVTARAQEVFGIREFRPGQRDLLTAGSKGGMRSARVGLVGGAGRQAPPTKIS